MGFVSLLVFCFILVILGLVTRPKIMGIDVLRTKARQIKPLVFQTRMAERDILKRIVEFAQESKYEIEDFDKTDSYIILSQQVGWNGLRLFFPIFLVRDPDGMGISVEVCLVTNSPFLENRVAAIYQEDHRRCFNGIRATLMIC
jgi:hypothetical protein